MKLGPRAAAWAAAALLVLGAQAASAHETRSEAEAPVGEQAPTLAQEAPGTRPVHRADPLEPFNRAVFAFNESLDEVLLKPVARAYRQVVPPLVRQGVRNVFGNVEDAWSAVNHVLQGKGEAGVQMMVRFVANTTIGIGGIFDVADEMGLERRSEDFGQTLGHWGVPAGPYLMLPLLGPRTLRDAAVWPLDRQASLAVIAQDGRWASRALTAVDVVHSRSELLATSDLIGQVALDRYTFVRDAHLARRRSLVYDGNPPADERSP